jgi:hypothetical protein
MFSRFFSRHLFGVSLASFSALSGLFALTYWYQSRQLGGPVAAAITSVVGCWIFYALYRLRIFRSDRIDTSLKQCGAFVERHTYLLLAGFIAIHLAWSGLVIFLNPFEWGYNHGDAVFTSQTLWNLVDGLRPENSYFTFSQGLPAGEDPRYCTAYGYVSVFTLFQNWLPMLILTPLYAVYPHPPMHVFAPLMVVVGIGLPGMFWAVRAAGGSRALALLGAVGYVLLPHVEILLFFKGYFDVLALAVMPWVFAALFARKWWVFYMASLCLGAISYPYTYTVMIIGAATAIFFRAPLQGTIAFVIGFFMMKWDSAVFTASVFPYYQDASAIPSFFKYFILNRTIGSLITPFQTNINYVGSILQAGAFLPFFALRQNNRWNLPLVGLLVITGISFVPMLFRSVAWEVSRNSNFIVPLYVCLFKAFVDITRTRESDISLPQNGNGPPKVVVSICMLCCMVSMILLGNDNRAPSPLASHYLWGENRITRTTESTSKRLMTMTKFDLYVPADAQLAFRAEGNFDAPLVNRQHSWHIGREPEGVKYYAFVGNMYIAGSEQLIEKMKRDERFKLLYEDASIPMFIFENLSAHPIPRDENLLGWGVLLGAFRFF